MAKFFEFKFAENERLSRICLPDDAIVSIYEDNKKSFLVFKNLDKIRIQGDENLIETLELAESFEAVTKRLLKD